MRIALDATYSLGDELSGIGVYSREILTGLAALPRDVEWEWFYRSQRYMRARSLPRPANVRRRFLADSFGSRSADLFHGLNQRLPQKRFRLQVATFHDLFVLSGDYSTREFRERFAAQAREAAARADLIVAVSAFTASQLESYLGVPRSRVRVVHHGVIPRAVPDLPREKMVLCVGAIQRRKNQARLIRAFRAMPADWTLLLAGSQGFEASEALRAAANSAAASRIHFTGYLSDEQIGRLYARASILAFPFLDEGFGMPVLEAMAAGLPVMAGNRSALPEICGDAAMLVDPFSEDEMGSALLNLANDASRRRELAAKGERQAAGFRWEKAVTETMAVYRELF